MRRREFVGLVGGAAVWPLLARAQTARKIPLVAILWHAGSPQEEGVLYEAMKEGFAKLGYVSGKNITFEERFPGETPGRFELFASELVALKPDVLVAVSVPSIRAAQKATITIPIVFLPPPDAIALKLFTNLSKPDGNLTGFTQMAEGLAGKRLELLKKTVPNISSVAMIYDPIVTYDVVQDVEATRLAAKNFGLEFHALVGSKPADLEPAFASILERRFTAIIVATGPMFFVHRERMATLALANKLPMIGPGDVFADAGFLMSYGPNWPSIFRSAPTYVDKLLKGATPADLPVQEPTVFELILNLKTAKAAGLEIPASIHLLADRVIE